MLVPLQIKIECPSGCQGCPAVFLLHLVRLGLFVDISHKDLEIIRPFIPFLG